MERRRLARGLAQVRAEKGYSQASLAKAVSSTQAVISRLEAGGDFNFSTFQRVTHALGFADVQTAMLEVARRGGTGVAKPAGRSRSRGQRKTRSRATRKGTSGR